MYHQVEVQKAGDTKSEPRVYWLWVHEPLKLGEGVIILEEGPDQYWIVKRSFMHLEELASLPMRSRLGHIEPRGDHEG